MPNATIGPIAVYFPENVETNDHLEATYSWDMDRIFEKTGIATRHIVSDDQFVSDLAVSACERLFRDHGIDRNSIDFLLLCTQTPDYGLPTTACLVQDRLGLPTTTGALDFNLGCSGFVYGLSMAKGLIETGQAERVLLVTAETYSKYIDSEDRSLRTIFGDAAAATLIEPTVEPSLAHFQFGTDGRGADTLFAINHGAVPADKSISPRHRKRWKSDLYMDGPSLINFTVEAVPRLVDQIVAESPWEEPQIRHYILHQATRKMLVQLKERMQLSDERMPIVLEHCGNTVSSTIPIVIEQLRRDGRVQPGDVNLLVGFGIGWSWAGCTWTAR
ncbi:MAG: ketoacyl-ACP synthase III [Pirellulaceae bacterium]